MRQRFVVVPVAIVLFALRFGGCVVVDSPFGARCVADADCGAGLVCTVDVCLPGAGTLLPDAGPDPDVDAGPDPDIDAGPDPDVDAGPLPVVVNRAPRAFGTTVVVAAGATATVTLEGSDPDGDALTFSITPDNTTGAVSLDGAVATVTALAADGAFTFTVSDGVDSDTATVMVKIAIPADDINTSVFIGENGDSWNVDANWSNGVPGQRVFGARVPAGKTVVVQSGPFNLLTLEVESGAVVELGGFSFNTSDARVGGTIRCTLSPCVRAVRVAGRLPSWQAIDGARLVGPTIIEGRLVTGFDFVVDNNALTVLGPVDAEGGFVQSGSVLHLEGSVAMLRNVSLSGGTWSLRGNFVRQGGNIISTGTHRLLLDAPDTQTLSLGDNACFNDLDVKTPQVTLGANAGVCGRLTIRAGARLGGAALLDVTGPIVLEDGGTLDVAELRPRGSITLAGDGFDVGVVRLTAGLTMPDLPYQDVVVSGNGTVSLDRDITITGKLGSNFNDFAEVDVGESTLTVGQLDLQFPSRLQMIFPDARVVVGGDVFIAPNNGSTMTNGVLEVGGDLSFGNAGNARYGDDLHTWRITGPTVLTSVAGSALVGRMEVAEGASLKVGDGTPLTFEPSNALVINGTLDIPAGTTLRLLARTTVTCGPAAVVTLTGLCTRADVPCEPLCP